MSNLGIIQPVVLLGPLGMVTLLLALKAGALERLETFELLELQGFLGAQLQLFCSR